VKKSLLIILILAMLHGVYFAHAQSGKVETFAIPKFKGGHDTTRFTGLGIDGRTGNLGLGGPNGWCEIPYRGGKLSFSGGFMAPTKGFKLLAVASGQRGIYVYDALAKAIMDERGKYALPVDARDVSGMAYMNDKIYLAERPGTIYILQLKNGKLDLLQETRGPSVITAMAAGNNYLYIAAGGYMHRYKEQMQQVGKFPISMRISGLTMGREGELLAVADGQSVIHRIVLP
jgi:hypothetical protein